MKFYPTIMPVPGEAISDRERNRAQLPGHDTSQEEAWVAHTPAFSLLQLRSTSVAPASNLSGKTRTFWAWKIQFFSCATFPALSLLPGAVALEKGLNLMSLRPPTLLRTPQEECICSIKSHFMFRTSLGGWENRGDSGPERGGGRSPKAFQEPSCWSFHLWPLTSDTYYTFNP